MTADIMTILSTGNTKDFTQKSHGRKTGDYGKLTSPRLMDIESHLNWSSLSEGQRTSLMREYLRLTFILSRVLTISVAHIDGHF